MRMRINKRTLLYFLIFVIFNFFLIHNGIAESKTTKAPMNPDVTLLSFDFQKISLTDLIKIISQSSQKNIILSDKIPQQNLSLHLEKVSWSQALTLILNSQGLAIRPFGNTLFIAPNSEIFQQTQQEFQLKEQQQQLAPLSSEILHLKFAKAQEIATMLKDKSNNLLSTRGNVGIDVRTNSLWIQDTPFQLTQISQLISQLDIPTQQVVIEARVVTIDSHVEKELGIKFGMSGGHHLSGNLNAADQLNNRVDPSTIPLESRLNFNFTQNMASNASGNAGLALFNLGDGYLLDLELDALEAEGEGEIIAKPSLVTANQQPAVIQTGEDIPYQEKTSGGATNVAFKKAVLSLEVTPQITSHHMILLNLHISQDKPSSKIINGVPAIDTREINTQVLVKNKQTLVLGGIYEESRDHEVERIPFMSKLPVVGKLFQHQYQQNEKKELLIFVRPTIATDDPIDHQTEKHITAS